MVSLGLGTVQFGLRYGIASSGAKMDSGDIQRTVEEARYNNVKTLDTAPRYGTSEEMLGKLDLDGFLVVTKTPRFISSFGPEMVQELVKSFHRSLQKLGVDHVYGLLVHDAGALMADGAVTLYSALRSLQEQGVVTKIGVSIYDGKEIDVITSRFKLDIVQLPVSVFDQRLIHSGHIRRLADLGVEVHARSVLLQGLLTVNDNQLPERFRPFRQMFLRWQNAVRTQNLRFEDAALTFVRDLEGMNTVLVGVMNADQLRRNAEAFASPNSFDGTGLSVDEPALIDPRLWTKFP